MRLCVLNVKQNFFITMSNNYTIIMLIIKLALGWVAHSSINFNCQLKLIGQIFPINFNWRFLDFICKFNRQLNLIDDDATEFI